MIKVDEGQANINVKVTPESQIAVGIDTQKKIDVIVGDAARMDCTKAVNYIQSGKAEIEPLVYQTEVFCERAEAAAQKAELYAQTFVYEQGIASAEWYITHNLNKRPSVTVVDSAENVITPEIVYIDNNNVVVRFNGATTGKAYLN